MFVYHTKSAGAIHNAYLMLLRYPVSRYITAFDSYAIIIEDYVRTDMKKYTHNIFGTFFLKCLSN